MLSTQFESKNNLLKLQSTLLISKETIMLIMSIAKGKMNYTSVLKLS